MIKLVSTISDKQQKWRNDPSIYAWTRQNGIIGEKEMENWKDDITYSRKIKMFGIEADTHKIKYEVYGGLVDQLPEKISESEKDLYTNVGTCGLTDIDYIHGKAEFSLLIGPEYQGNGYGKAALLELLKYGFHHFRLNLIWGETIEGNPAREMFKKLGFIEEGLLRKRYFKNGEYKNSTMFSIMKEEYDLKYNS